MSIKISIRDELNKIAKGYFPLGDKNVAEVGTRVLFGPTQQEGEITNMLIGNPEHIRVILDGDTEERIFKLDELNIVG